MAFALATYPDIPRPFGMFDAIDDRRAIHDEKFYEFFDRKYAERVSEKKRERVLQTVFVLTLMGLVGALLWQIL